MKIASTVAAALDKNESISWDNEQLTEETLASIRAAQEKAIRQNAEQAAKAESGKNENPLIIMAKELEQEATAIEKKLKNQSLNF